MAGTSLTQRAQEMLDAVQSTLDADGQMIGFDLLVDRARARLAQTGPDDPDHAFRLYLLGIVLLGAAVEVGQAGTRADALQRIDEGIEMFRRAAGESAVDDPHRQDYRFELAAALGARAMQNQSTPDAEESLSLLRKVVALTRPSHPHLAKRLSGLAQAAGLAATRHGDPDGMDEAAELHVEALAATVPGDPRSSAYLSGFGSTLLDAAELRRDDRLLVQAQQAFVAALRTASPYDPKIPGYAFGFGRARGLVQRRRRGWAGPA